MKTQTDYDLVIIGGGMVGATLARALAGTGLRLALIEPRPQTSQVDGRFDLRVSAITRASQRVFEALGVWPSMQAKRVSPFREMHVWEAQGKEMHFDSADLSEPYLGHIIENSVITASLYDGIEQQGNLDCLFERRCQQLAKSDQDVWQLQLDDGSELRADLLVGADGSRSWLRQQVGIAVRGWDYDHAALVTYVRTEKSHEETAWQRFVNGGPLAFLPLCDGYSSIVWSTQPDNAQRLCELDETAFAEELTMRFAARLGRVLEVGPRATYPLRFLMADQYVQAGVALVGDAAHTVHPLAGQGVNLGLLDAAALAEVLHDASKARRRIASLQTLRRYERWRRSENLSMLVMVDQIQRLFGNDQPVLQWLRTTGMNLVDYLPLVKDEIIEHAMGNRGDLPKLAKAMG